MLKSVRVRAKDFDAYKDIIGRTAYKEVVSLAKQFKGKRVLHINATAHGGGVAQILHSLVPMMRDLGIDAHWKLIQPSNFDFFVATKKIHNSLQGAKLKLKKSEWKLYDAQNQQFADGFKPDAWDYIIVHDPQPAAMRQYASANKAKWVWRCHIDLSAPNIDTREHLLPYLRQYDGAVFTLKQYTLKALKKPKVGIIPVAIDPIADKNLQITHRRARQLVGGFGINHSKPLIVQISRFDPWKDPLGVIKAWKLAKKKIPDLQLVLMGDAADDDPEGKDVLEQVMDAIAGQEDVFIVTDTDDHVVNAFQTMANVVLQKSIREGFGLTVTEALWAKTPVIGGNVGGIPEQVKNGRSGYLVNSPTEAAKYIVKLIQEPLKAQALGQWGHEYVREHFLLPHMLKADLKFLAGL